MTQQLISQSNTPAKLSETQPLTQQVLQLTKPIKLSDVTLSDDETRPTRPTRRIGRWLSDFQKAIDLAG